MEVVVTTGNTINKIKEEVSSMLGHVKSLFKAVVKYFFQPAYAERSENEWKASVFELTDEEIFRYVNESLSNFSFLKSSYSLKNISENVYLKNYLENTHEALEVLRIVMLSRAKNIKSLSSWNTRVIDTINEIEMILTGHIVDINKCYTDISNVSIAWLKMIIGNPKKDCVNQK